MLLLAETGLFYLDLEIRQGSYALKQVIFPETEQFNQIYPCFHLVLQYPYKAFFIYYFIRKKDSIT